VPGRALCLVLMPMCLLSPCLVCLPEMAPRTVPFCTVPFRPQYSTVWYRCLHTLPPVQFVDCAVQYGTVPQISSKMAVLTVPNHTSLLVQNVRYGSFIHCPLYGTRIVWYGTGSHLWRHHAWGSYLEACPAQGPPRPITIIHNVKSKTSEV
jgi:hypothetical protein